MSESLSLQLFGAFRAQIGPAPVDLSAGTASAIIARLALSAGLSVTTEQLVADLWELPPANAAGSLRVYVSRMRSGPLGEYLRGGRGGYLLDADPDRIDVLRFGQLTESGLWEDALALWVGEPFVSLEGFPFVRQALSTLREKRLLALEKATDARISRGEAAVSIVELAPLVAREPTQERLVSSLALAYAAEGRVSNALAVIDRSREVLQESQGLDPSARMDSLRQSILRQDPSLLPSGAGDGQVERHGIPVPLSRLFGRDETLEHIEQSRASNRLVSLVGPGGVGKTRLAVESARRSTRTIDVAQWMVDLSTVEAGGDVFGAAADRLGATAHDVGAIAARVSDRPTLLILDNAEHVLPSARSLARELLARCGGLAILVTSREPLGIAGEFIIRVRGLIGSDAETGVELFRERSAAARGGLVDASGDASLIRRLCRLLDGLPLALELAAARTDVLSIAEMVRSLDRGEQLESAEIGADRHSSLESTIRWSTDGLDSEELGMLTELSLFAGPFTLDAVERICATRERSNRDVVLSLARKSLVSVDEMESGQRRYRLLESMRAFVKPMRDPAKVTDWYLRHRLYLADLVDELAPAIRTHHAAEAHATLDALSADLTLATEHAIEDRDKEVALRIAGGQAWHWFKRGLLVEGRSVIDRALSTPGEADALVEAKALIGIVNLAYQAGDADAAFGYVERGLERAAASGDLHATASLLAYVAYGRSLFGRPEEAEELIDQAVACSTGGPDWLRAEILMSRGQILRVLRRPAEALDNLADARRLAAASGHSWALTSAEYVAGKILIEVRRAPEAIALLVAGARSALAGGDVPGALALLHLVAGATSFIERHRDGARIFGAVDAIGRRYSYNPVSAEGADAQVHRDRVSAALLPKDFAVAYESGAQLSLEMLLGLAAELTKAR